jgi:hypothetical protein
LGKLEFVRDRLGQTARSMRESDISGIADFLDD